MNTIQRADKDNEDFQKMVECSILEAIEHGAKSFGDILLNLPSVYPSVALKTLQYLKSIGRIPNWIWDTCSENDSSGNYSPSHNNSHLPVPHPLDFEWRFNAQAIDLVLKKSYCLSQNEDTIALIGVPSVFDKGISTTEPKRHFLLVDVSASNIAYFSDYVSADQLFHYDLMRTDIPDFSAQVVVLDAPWYPEYIQRFLYIASRSCIVNGYVLASMPPSGTRPGMNEEWCSYLNYAQEIGLELVELQPLVLPYISPFFERNALRASGIMNYPNCWRRGNLAVFRRVVKPLQTLIVEVSSDSEWEEIVIQKVRFRIRKGTDQACSDSTLKQIVSGDILPTVSRRDPRFHTVDVWTSGNRVFQCRKGNLLKTIMKSIANQRPIYDELKCVLKRFPTKEEMIFAEITTQQIRDVVRLETMEMLQYGT